MTPTTVKANPCLICEDLEDKLAEAKRRYAEAKADKREIKRHSPERLEPTNLMFDII